MPSTIKYNNLDRPLPALTQDEGQILLTAAGDRTTAPDNTILDSTGSFIANYGQQFVGEPPTDTDWIQQAQRIPLLLGGAILEALPGWIHLFLRQVIGIRQALECICEKLTPTESRLQVFSEVTARPENISVTFGQPAPDIFAAGWVVFKNAGGLYGHRSYIFTDRQVHVADIPDAVGYDTYVMPGYTIDFQG